MIDPEVIYFVALIGLIRMVMFLRTMNLESLV